MSDAPLRRVIAFRLVTHDPVALARFYGEALGAAPIGTVRFHDAASGGSGDRASLAIGAQRIDLDVFDAPGAPAPRGLAANDPRFQHIAFVVMDIGAVYDRAMACGARAISRGGPVVLPASSGGVTAVKLRDPDGHPFELLHFPPGGDWGAVAANARGVCGLDHSAIAVGDARASAAFYARHGLAARGAGVNRGPTQAALDGLDAPVVDVVPLYPDAAGPHLELLGYRGSGPPTRPVGARDVLATRIAWVSDRDGRLIDPDGHRHQLIAPVTA